MRARRAITTVGRLKIVARLERVCRWSISCVSELLGLFRGRGADEDTSSLPPESLVAMASPRTRPPTATRRRVAPSRCRDRARFQSARHASKIAQRPRGIRAQWGDPYPYSARFDCNFNCDIFCTKHDLEPGTKGHFKRECLVVLVPRQRLYCELVLYHHKSFRTHRPR
jgi:hypothetical protein